MAILLSAHQLKKSFGARTLFESLTFSISKGERIGLVGPNGVGKSTLLKILAGRESLDDGTLSFAKGTRIACLDQVPSFKPKANVFESVLEACEDIHDGESLALTHEYLSKLSLDGSQGVSPETLVETLSGGWKKRVALARECVKQPDLFLLDEPTNHFDLETILWLENWLERAPFATLTITHDRSFLQNISNRIIELDPRYPEGLLSVSGTYADFLDLKAQKFSEQEKQEQVLKNTLRRETEWLRRGPKARGTKQQARIDRAGDLKAEVESLQERNRSSSVQLQFQGAERHPKKLIHAKNISKSFQERTLFSEVELLLSPKSCLALLGPNGCGKSTLIRILVGSEKPDTGEVFHADGLQIAYFEQNRETLDPTLTLMKTLCPKGDHVEYRGQYIHIRSYLDRFLFKTAQMDLPVGRLSGGEQSRLLLARLMLQPAQVLVLDEPTNDLDLPTLRILEDCLKEFEGAILLVSHDRYFVDQLATQLIGFPENSEDKSLIAFADLDQWETWYQDQKKSDKKKKETPSTKNSNSSSKKRLSFKEQFEWDGMEKIIAEKELSLADLQSQLAQPEHSSNPVKLIELTEKISFVESEIEKLYARWAELENKMNTF